MDLYKILEGVCVPSHDNGEEFTNTERLDFITKFLAHTKYRKINPNGLFYLYASKKVNFSKPVVIVSSHIDCVMTKCFTRFTKRGLLTGTYDNAITNAAALYVMENGNVSDNVLFAFTGDEEHSSKGAEDVIAFLETRKINADYFMVLDVTEEGWEDKYNFTIENNFWSYDTGRHIMECAKNSGQRWGFVPSYMYGVFPEGIISYEDIIPTEAECDESWTYESSEEPPFRESFSLCIPVSGNMHSNEGVLARPESFEGYAKILESILVL